MPLFTFVRPWDGSIANKLSNNKNADPSAAHQTNHKMGSNCCMKKILRIICNLFGWSVEGSYVVSLILFFKKIVSKNCFLFSLRRFN